MGCDCILLVSKCRRETKLCHSGQDSHWTTGQWPHIHQTVMRQSWLFVTFLVLLCVSFPTDFPSPTHVMPCLFNSFTIKTQNLCIVSVFLQVCYSLLLDSHYSLMYVGSLSSTSVRVLTRVAKFGLSCALADQQDAITAHLWPWHSHKINQVARLVDPLITNSIFWYIACSCSMQKQTYRMRKETQIGLYP